MASLLYKQLRVTFGTGDTKVPLKELGIVERGLGAQLGPQIAVRLLAAWNRLSRAGNPLLTISNRSDQPLGMQEGFVGREVKRDGVAEYGNE